MAKVNFSKQYIRPNPLEVDYWVDLDENPYCAVIKYYNGEDWVQLNGSGGSASDFDFYTKSQINKMLANKADVEDVESKVDDSELAEVIKNIQVREIGNDKLQLVIFTYDDSKIGLTLPTATATNPGILAGSDFVNFVKQNQLQALYSEMYDLFADIRSKYQLKLTAGNNIVIDKINNTISVVDDIKVDWDRVRSKPNFHKISVTGDYADLKNKLTAGVGIEINSENQINVVPDVEIYEIVDVLPTTDINNSKVYLLLTQSNDSGNIYTEYIYVDNEWKVLRTFKTNIDLKNLLSKDDAKELFVNKELFNSSIETIEEKSDYAVDTSIEFSQVATDAKTIAEAAKNAVSTLEGLSDIDMSTIVAAQVITQVEQNSLQIQNILQSEVLITQAQYDALEVKDPTVKYYIYEE